MIPFRFEHEFRGSVARYWELFFDDDVQRAQFERVGVKVFEILERVDTGDTITRRLHVVPKRDIPAVIKKVTGASLGYTEQTTLYRRRNVADTVVVPTTLGGRTVIGGQHTVTELGDGRFVRAFVGAITIAVPLVGKKIEKAIFEDMERSYADGAKITQGRLDAS